MTIQDKMSKSLIPGKTDKPNRQKRLSDALRENLRKRKSQATMRKEIKASPLQPEKEA